MARLNIPSLQHMARNWRSDPAKIGKVLVRLAQNPPNFSYNPLHGAVTDLLVLRQPYEEVVEGIHRGIRREGVRNNLLSILPLIRQHFDGIAPDFVQTVDRRYYPVGRGLMVPFEPPLFYGVGGRLHFPWFSFWRANPLDAERLSLFVTIVEEMLLQDPDLEDAKFQILDFSAPAPKQPRALNVIDSRDITRIPNGQKIEMLSTFAEGYFLALAELSTETPATTEKEPENKAQLGLFDHRE